ncbi:MAG TPA: type II toxin-antitoxin system VapC family toxin [Thermoanaerobaculia bacterium]
MIHLDTSFLVDLLRETARGKEGPASRLLASVQDEELGASVFVACELAAGAAISKRPVEEKRRVDQLFAALQMDYPDEHFPNAYGSLLAALELGNGRIAAMDLLIAASAVLAGAPLVTRNAKDFQRVPGLEVRTY